MDHYLRIWKKCYPKGVPLQIPKTYKERIERVYPFLDLTEDEKLIWEQLYRSEQTLDKFLDVVGKPKKWLVATEKEITRKLTSDEVIRTLYSLAPSTLFSERLVSKFKNGAVSIDGLDTAPGNINMLKRAGYMTMASIRTVDCEKIMSIPHIKQDRATEIVRARDRWYERMNEVVEANRYMESKDAPT